MEEYSILVSIFPNEAIDTDYLALTKEGLLTTKKGYAWDGPSGPTIDTPDFMRGSLAHDALYQLMRNGFISKDKWRKSADRELRRICLEDGMSALRTWGVYQAVRLFGDKAASEETRKEIKTAP